MLSGSLQYSCSTAPIYIGEQVSNMSSETENGKRSLAPCTLLTAETNWLFEEQHKMSSGTNQNDSLPMFLGLKLVDLTLQCVHYNA